MVKLGSKNNSAISLLLAFYSTSLGDCWWPLAQLQYNWQGHAMAGGGLSVLLCHHVLYALVPNYAACCRLAGR